MALVVMVGATSAVQSGHVAAAAGSGPAAGGAVYAQPFDAIPTASPEHLATLRGGLRAGGLDMEFAANVRTLVNGTLVLESVTNLAPGGATVTQSHMPATGMDPQALSFVSGLGSDQANALPANLSGLAGHTGVVIADPSGVTTALHSVTREQILGVVLTTASDQHIRQEINVEVTVANFGRFQDAARSALLSGQLFRSLNFSQ